MGLIEADVLPIADSPRIYVSTNPWKITADFHTISSTREEYIATIESLKTTAPPELKKGQKRLKPEQLHLHLIAALEARIEAIDAELAVSGEFLNIYPMACFSPFYIS